MAEKQTIVGVLLAIAIPSAAAVIGATQQPWWWCRFATCAPADKPTDTPANPPGPVQSRDTDVLPRDPPSPVQKAWIMSGLEPSINRNGADILPSKRVESPESCSRLCDAADECRAMTYVIDASDHSAGGICWLKNEVPEATPAPNMTSAVKQYR